MTAKKISRGQVWLVNTPSFHEKIRPALVLAHAARNAFIVVPLFRNREDPTSAFEVEITGEESGLPQTFVAECNTIATLPRESFEKFAGNLSAVAFSRVKKTIISCLELDCD